jgi:heme/copper-type cytochrome/quinol oxidase subunit 3
VWPPKGIVPLTPCTTATGNTFLLLASGVFLTQAHAALIVGDRVGTLKCLVQTLVLAGLFTFFQYQEYKLSAIHFNDSVFGSIFFMITGFHGFHVLVGTIFIGTCFFRVLNKSVTFTRQQHSG